MNIFSFSFGKDSMATLILAAEQGIPIMQNALKRGMCRNEKRYEIRRINNDKIL